jgi:hypothetical protein
MQRKKVSLAGYFLPRLQDLIFILIFFFVLRIGSNLFRDGDPGRHIVSGEIIFNTLTIPTRELFLYPVQGQPSPPYAWLAEVIYVAGYKALGLGGLVVVAALLLSITFTLVYNELMRRGAPRLLSALLTLWAASLTAIHWLARPHLFSFLFMALLVSRLTRLAKGENVPLWQFPLILLLWANTHTAFIFAFLVWAIFIVGNLWESFAARLRLDNPTLRKLLLSAILSLAATFINPAGWRLWKLVLTHLSSSYLSNLISEYHSPNFHDISGLAFLLTIVASILALSLSNKKHTPAETLLLGAWTALGLYASRDIPLYAIVTIPLWAGYARQLLDVIPPLARLERQIESLERQLRGMLWPVVVSLVCIALLASGVKLDAAQQGYAFNTVEYPVSAVDWIESHPQTGNMFNYFPWGGYLIYRLWPQYEMFIDGQFFYGETYIRQHQQVLTAEPGWEAIIQQYDIHWALLPADSTLAKVLTKESGWFLLYQDQTAVVFRLKE